MTSSSSSLPSTTTAIVENNTNKQYLCLFHIITAGLLDENLGSDEQEIIEMIYLIIDVDQKTVCQLGSILTDIFIKFFVFCINRL
jgi:hypothetical protein